MGTWEVSTISPLRGREARFWIVSAGAWSLNLRLRYTYRPGSALFVIYNAGNQINSLAAGNPILLQQKRLSIKLTYSFQR